MGVTVSANKRSVVHKGSGGITIIFPDICKTPVGPSIVPIPYPNVAKSSTTKKGTKKVKCDGKTVDTKKSIFKSSLGDQPGVMKGIISSKVGCKAEFISASGDVKFEGNGVTRALDMMLHNSKNTPPAPVLQKPIIGTGKDSTDCGVCGKDLDS